MTRGKCVGLGANDFWLGTLAVFLLLAGFDRPTSAAQGDDHALITQGEYLARAGDCIACHTDPGGALFAGGRPMATPFGTIYTSNITPDPTTGIGSWTADQFYRTMHTNLSDADMRDLAAYYAYLPRPSDYPLIAGVRPRIVASGAPMRGIAPCGACHGDLDSKAGAGWLRGQPAVYLRTQLEAFSSGARHNDIGEQMRNIARQMTAAEIGDATEFYANR